MLGQFIRNFDSSNKIDNEIKINMQVKNRRCIQIGSEVI